MWLCGFGSVNCAQPPSAPRSCASTSAQHDTLNYWVSEWHLLSSGFGSVNCAQPPGFGMAFVVKWFRLRKLRSTTIDSTKLRSTTIGSVSCAQPPGFGKAFVVKWFRLRKLRSTTEFWKG